MLLSPEDLFRLATGFVDLSAWMSAEKQGLSRANRQPSLDRRHRRRHPHRNATDLASLSTSTSPSFMCHATSDRSSPVMMTPSPLSTFAVRTWTCAASRTTCGTAIPAPKDSELMTTTMRLRSCCSSSSSPASSTSLASSSPSSRRSTTSRSSLWPSTLTFLVMAALLFRIGECCSSRSTPKPRPPPPPSPLPSGSSNHRPNITFQTYACPPAYAAWYCLNGATCFTVKIAESILYNCECTDGYVGQRCEFKDLEGSYLPLREKIMLEKASIAGGATVAVVLVVILSIIFYTYVRQRRKDKRLNVTETRLERIETHRLQQRAMVHRVLSQPVFTLQTSAQTSPTRQALSTSHVGPDSPRERESILPSNSRACKRNETEELCTVATGTAPA